MHGYRSTKRIWLQNTETRDAIIYKTSEKNNDDNDDDDDDDGDGLTADTFAMIVGFPNIVIIANMPYNNDDNKNDIVLYVRS